MKKYCSHPGNRILNFRDTKDHDLVILGSEKSEHFPDRNTINQTFRILIAKIMSWLDQTKSCMWTSRNTRMHNNPIMVGMTLISFMMLIGCSPVLVKQDHNKINSIVIKVVSNNNESVSWDERSILKVDPNCDGQKDYAVLGKTKTGVAVALVVGPVSLKSTVVILEFLVGANSQDSLCELPASLGIESLDYVPNERDQGELPGFQRSKRCFSFYLADEACDSFHFYWDHQANTLLWWRL